MAWFSRLRSSESGSILVMSAFALTAIMGMSGLAVEIGSGYTAKVRNQRVADMAALGAAVAYRSTQSVATATQVAQDIVVANGLPASTAIVTLPVTIGSATAVQVQITTAVPIKIASVLTDKASYDVQAVAAASLTSITTTGCITALSNGSTAVSADGGAAINASGCAVVTNGTIYSSNSSAKVSASSIVAQAINDTAAQWSQNAVTTTPTAKNWTLKPDGATDFVKGNSTVQNALCYVNQLTGASDPDYGGGNTSCVNPLVATPALTNTSPTDWSASGGLKGQGGISNYQTADYSCSYVIPAGTYNLRDLTVNGGCSVVFQGPSILNFRNVTMNGASLNFGDGPITISGTFNVSGNYTVTMGSGAHSFGTLAIGGGKSLTTGSGNFYVAGGLSLSGGAFLKAGISTGDTVTIGNDGANAITVGGGSQLCFTANCAMATAAAGTFSANGNVNVQGGGSLIAFPKAAMHVINGDLIATAGVLFGPGLYVIKGNFTNTTGSGSDSMNGTDVTFALGGIFNFAGGSRFDLAATSSSTSGYGIQDMLFLTKSSAATSVSAGAIGKASGMIYAPNSAFSSSGGSAISSNGSACMMLMVKAVSVTGSGTVNTAGCSSVSSSASSAPVALIQ